MGVGSTGSASDSKPPQEKPMPNSSSPSISAAAAARFLPFRMNENSPVAPLKSRAQIEWPGQDGKAGCRTRATSGCSASQAAIFRALARSEEHTSELQSLMRISYAVFCLKKKKQR